MKKLALSLFLVLLLAACSAGLPGSDAPAKTTAASTPAQNAASPPPPVASAPVRSYTIQGSAILNDDYEPIYDAAPYYEQGWTVWINNLTQVEDALYFTEGAAFNDGISCICESAQKGAVNAIVTTGLDGSGRKVLASNTDPDGYYDMQPFSGRVFFIDGSEQTARLSYVGNDGSDAGTLSLPAGDSAGLFKAALSTDGEYLIVEMDFGSEHAEAAASYTFRIDKDLNIERL